MGIIVLSLLAVIILRVENKINLRHKYKKFSSKFNGYYIDFISLIILLSIDIALICLIAITPMPEFLINYIFICFILYSLFIVLPIKIIDDFVKNIYKINNN